MYHVEIFNHGGYSFNVHSKNYEFVIDPDGNGITPPEALLASIGSCFGVYIRKYAEGAKLAISDFDITVDGDFLKDKPVCFKNISVSVDLKNAELNERRKASLLEFIKNCPVHNTLKADPTVTIKIV